MTRDGDGLPARCLAELYGLPGADLVPAARKEGSRE
jgi:hypothetical protein